VCEQVCILTTKDLTILEVMLDRRLGRGDPLVPLLRRKIRSAQVVLRDDVPENVATLGSCVIFTVDGGPSQMRVICHDRMGASATLFLPITEPLGLALLGLAEGESFRIGSGEDDAGTVTLEKILRQPEAARRDRERNAAVETAERRPAVLSLIRGGGTGSGAKRPVDHDGFHDPGPSAA
jgi:regulator of nucleoside diphosphate kinase